MIADALQWQRNIENDIENIDNTKKDKTRLITDGLPWQGPSHPLMGSSSVGYNMVQ